VFNKTAANRFKFYLGISDLNVCKNSVVLYLFKEPK
jgi:hypothetical protein